MLMHTHPQATPAPAGQRGLTLIEVLVAVLVIAVGLLGLAGLQAGALQSNRIAYERTQASMLAYDITERMRANRNAALNGSYDNTLAETTSSGGPAPVPADVADWNQRVADQMANGQGAVLTGAAAGCATCVRVTIQWDRREDEDPDDGQDETTTFVYETRL